MHVQPSVHSVKNPPSVEIHGSDASASPNATLFDEIFAGAVKAGVGLAVLADLFGLPHDDIVNRAAVLDLPRPHDRPARTSSSRVWTIEGLRQLVTLWTDHVATASIAAAIGRSVSSIYYRRKKLGLSPRARSNLRLRSIADCASTPMTWLPSPAPEVVAEPVAEKKLVSSPKPKRRDRWNPDLNKSCSYLAFAGFTNAAIAKRLSKETCRTFTAKSVADKLSRLQAFRDRETPAVNMLPEEEIVPRAELFIARWRLQWRKCEGTGHNFWYSAVRGGPRNTCREFERKKYAKKRQDRACAAHFGAI